MRKAVRYSVLALLVIAGLFASTSAVVAGPPAKAELPKTELVCINYWPDGEYLGVRFKLIPVGSSPEAYAAVYQSAIIEIATEHGRHDLVDRVMRGGVHIVDKEAFAAETGFTPDSLVSASTIGISTDAAALSSTQELRYTPDRLRRPPRRGGVPCTCSSLVCSADVCGRYYCSGACGGCNLCG